MCKESEDDDVKAGKMFTSLVIVIGLAVIASFVVSYTDYLMMEDEINHLHQVISDIQSNENVSSDYISGWNDCISELINYRQRAQNITSNVMNQTT